MMNFCPTLNTMIVGNKDTTIPALRMSQLTPAFEINELSANGTTTFDSEESSMTARNSSFQMFTNEKLKIATIPGRVTGRMTRKSAWSVLQPSISAASSIEGGIR